MENKIVGAAPASVILNHEGGVPNAEADSTRSPTVPDSSIRKRPKNDPGGSYRQVSGNGRKMATSPAAGS